MWRVGVGCNAEVRLRRTRADAALTRRQAARRLPSTASVPPGRCHRRSRGSAGPKAGATPVRWPISPVGTRASACGARASSGTRPRARSSRRGRTAAWPGSSGPVPWCVGYSACWGRCCWGCCEASCDSHGPRGTWPCSWWAFCGRPYMYGHHQRYPRAQTKVNEWIN